MILIGIMGKAQTGKDTVAQFLVQEFKFEQFAFATALKLFCTNLFCLSYHQLNTPEGKQLVDKHYKKSPREILQQTGDALRSVYNNIWVEQLDRKIVGHPRVVISDVRFRNEAEYVKKNGGFLIKLVRTDFSIGGKEAAHVSENDLDRATDLVDLTVAVKSGELDKLKFLVYEYVFERLINSDMREKI